MKSAWTNNGSAVGVTVGRPERPLDPEAGPLQRFALELRKLRREAGQPGYRELSRRAHYSVTALSEAAGGEALPSLDVAMAYARACGGDPRVWEARWHAAAAELAPAVAPDGAGPAPYLGLATFEPQDAARFFGREELVEELCRRLVSDRLLAVFGASGSGKSSLLRAGVLPALTTGAAAGDGKWLPLLLTPGARPLEELALQLADFLHVEAASLHTVLTGERPGARLALRQALAASPSRTQRVLIVVDQFEEVFTLCSDVEERSAFIDCLLAAADAPGGRVRVVLGIRADFYGRCAEHPPLVAVLRDRQLLVGPMDGTALRQAITEPAARMGLSVQPSLVETILTEAEHQPGVLPLVSHALLETWRHRNGGPLTLAGYRAVGGLREAVAQTAERIHERLENRERRLLREIFLRLTALGEGTEDTRRRVQRTELLGLADDAHGETVEDLLAELIAARLVTSDQDGVSVTHEALIRGWPRLRGWLSEDREVLRAHRRLTEAAAEWDHQGQDDGFLYQGPRLDAWDTRPLDALNDREHAFLAAARGQRARHRAAGRRRIGAVLTGLVAMVAALAVLASLAVVQTGHAREERTLAFSRQLAANARGQLDLDPELALLLAREAYRVRPTTEVEAVLRQATADARLRSTFPLLKGARQCGASYSPDGHHLVTSGADGTVRVWTLSPRRGEPVDPVVLRGHQGEAWSPVFSPDGQWVASAGIDGTVRIVRWRDPHGAGSSVVLRGHTDAVWSVAFSPDGRRIASASDDHTVRIRSVSGEGTGLVLREPGRVLGVAFSPDGRRLAVGVSDGTVRVRDADGAGGIVTLGGDDDTVEGVAFSPDGLRVASASTDGAVRVRRADGTGEPVVMRGHGGTAESVTFSADGRRVASTGNDSTIRVWNADSGEGPMVLRGHRSTVWSAAFSPDGSRLVSTADDGARLWDVTGTGNPVVLRGSRGPVWSVALSPRADRLAAGGADGVVRVWPTGGGSALFTGRGHHGDVNDVAFAPDGQHVASAGTDSTVRLWDLTGRAEPVVLRGAQGAVWSVAFSPDGSRLAAAGADGSLRLWNLDSVTAPPTVLPAHRGALRYLAYSPDGRHVATAEMDGTALLWDLASPNRRPLVLRGHQGMVWNVAFSPDGGQLATAGNDGTLRLWDVTGTRADDDPLVLRGHQGLVWGVAFGPGAGLVTSSGNDGTVRIWDPSRTGEPVTLSGFGASVEGVDAAASAGLLATAHDDGTARVWQCEVCGPIDAVLRLAAQRTTRRLTADERAIYLRSGT